MPIENLTDARVRGLKHVDGEIIDAKTGLIARADRTGVTTFSFRYRPAGSAARRRFTVSAVSLERRSQRPARRWGGYASGSATVPTRNRSDAAAAPG